MGELELGKMLAAVCLLSIAMEILMAIILSILSCWLEYTLRKPKDTFELGSKWAGKYNKVYGITTDEHVPDFITSIFTTMLLLGLLSIGYFFTGTFVYGLVVLCVVLSCIFVPRFVIDICRSLKYNRKTEDSDRINKLEKELLAIKEKQT